MAIGPQAASIQWRWPRAAKARSGFAGAGGLYHFSIADDRLTTAQLISTDDIQTNSVVALMADHRGWIWVGTSSGVSVYNGKRWVSVNTDTGMLSDDVDENGLAEDQDGSVWITTTQGLSHLLDPEWIFVNRPVSVVVSTAMLGANKVTGKTLPYTRGALTVQFGTPNGNSERSFLFRYSPVGRGCGMGGFGKWPAALSVRPSRPSCVDGDRL